RPMTAEARELEALIEFQICRTVQTQIDWEPRCLLIIDNQRMVHARGKSNCTDENRTLKRILIGGGEMQSWESKGLWKKAKLFMDHANEHDHASPEFAFFAALAIECLARSALTKVHPVLNADPREDSNILYGCGYSFAKPRSLPAHSVYLRLE